MTSFWLRMRLFLSAYSLLFFISALHFSAAWIRWSTFALGVLGVIFTTTVLLSVAHKEPEPRDIAALRDRGVEVAAFMATYLLPFVVAPDPTAMDVAAYTVFLLTVAIVYGRSEMIQVNPIFYLIGYRVLRATGEDGAAWYLVTRHPPSVGDRVFVRRFDEAIAVESDPPTAPNSGG